MFKPEITVTLFPRKKKATTDSAPVTEPKVDYVAAAEEAAVRLGKKLVIGAVVVTVSTVVAATIGAIAVEATKSALNK